MSMFDDILRRHQETEKMRKKISDKKNNDDPMDAIMRDMAKLLAGTGNTAANTVSTSSPSRSMYPTPSSMRFHSSQLMSHPAFTIDPYTGVDMAAKPKPKPKPVVKKVDFASVILSEEKKQMIVEALEQLKNNDLIFEKWGFGKTLEKGKAVSMLFYGPPGTGKTLMAQAIADQLGFKLKIVGTAEIESSEPGGAERAIKAIFQGAKKDTVLLFDECDSLIYDRASLGSILAAQVNQLLSSLENFEGVCLFTTNRLGVLDEALSRRLSLKMEFDLPSFDERIKIWKRMFPKEAPIGDINWEELAEPEISGGHIKNAVLRAARSAASSKAKTKLITQEILKKALVAELREMAKFLEAKENTSLAPKQVGYQIRKG